MEASLCCCKYHGKEAPTEPIGPTAGPTHLIAEPSLTNDSHTFFLYILLSFLLQCPSYSTKMGKRPLKLSFAA